MHDVIFENQRDLSDKGLESLAKKVKVDVKRLRKDLEEETYGPRVRSDFMSGVRSGVNGTPTFFINGVRHEGSWDLPSLLAALQAPARRGLHCARGAMSLLAHSLGTGAQDLGLAPTSRGWTNHSAARSLSAATRSSRERHSSRTLPLYRSPLLPPCRPAALRFASPQFTAAQTPSPCRPA